MCNAVGKLWEASFVTIHIISGNSFLASVQHISEPAVTPRVLSVPRGRSGITAHNLLWDRRRILCGIAASVEGRKQHAAHRRRARFMDR
jgi:hypothetical protein